jgi:hypothetical protein
LSRDVRDFLDGRVLGDILQEKRNRTDPFLRKPGRIENG